MILLKFALYVKKWIRSVRGDIYRLKTRDSHGHEQRGPRFAIVVQSDRVRISTLLVAPTSTRAQPSDMRPRINLNGTTTFVMVDQTTAVDLTRLGDFAGRLDANELVAIDDALRLVFGLC